MDFQETLAAFDRERRELEVSGYWRLATPEPTGGERAREPVGVASVPLDAGPTAHD